MIQKSNIIPAKIIELELEIKILEYLKRENSIDENMYNYVIDKLINKIEKEKAKMDEEYIKNINNYKLITS